MANNLLKTAEEKASYEAGLSFGKAAERERIIDLIERRICFDALDDPDGRCSNHSGKCYDLRGLINGLQGKPNAH